MNRSISSLVIAVVVLCALPASGQGAAVDSLNGDLQRVWGRLAPALIVKYEGEAATQLAAYAERTPTRTIEVTRVEDVSFDCQAGPGFTALTPGAFELAVPVRGRWALTATVEVRVRQKVAWWWATARLRARVTVDRVRLTQAVALDLADPARPTIRRVARPDLSFRVRVRSDDFWQNVLFVLLSPIGDFFAKRAVQDAIDGFLPSLTALQGLPGAIPAANAAPLVDSGANTPFAEIVGNIDAEIRRDHLPYGALARIQMDTYSDATWATAFRDGGGGNPGNVVDHLRFRDSAIFTGQYLASQAFRYRETRSAAALDNVRHTLQGIGALLDVYGGRGLLARYAAPANSLLGRRIIGAGHRLPYFSATVNGETWVAEEDNRISRDQYLGVFFGLGVAHDLVDDAQVKRRCRDRLTQMLDYLIAHDWYVDEDRPAYDGAIDIGGEPVGPTFWTGCTYQKMSMLLAGERAAPGRYAQELAAAGLEAPVAWLGQWYYTWSLDDYFHYNLQHLAYYTYFNLETHVGRWQEMLRGYRFVERWVGHHQNPHFDLIGTTVDPSRRGAKFSGVREALRQFLESHHRMMSPAVIDLSAVTYETHELMVLPTPDDPSPSATKAVTLPSAPLPARLRKPAQPFAWQNTPFQAATKRGERPYEAKAGLDVVLPYWMGRHLGAFGSPSGPAPQASPLHHQAWASLPPVIAQSPLAQPLAALGAAQAVVSASPLAQPLGPLAQPLAALGAAQAAASAGSGAHPLVALSGVGAAPTASPPAQPQVNPQPAAPSPLASALQQIGDALATAAKEVGAFFAGLFKP